MSRTHLPQLPADARDAGPAVEPAPIDRALLAEDIAAAALELAKRARAAGLTTIGYLLETAALEAGAEAASARWPADPAER